MLNTNDCWKDEDYKEIVQYTSREFWRIIQRNSKETSPLSLFLNLTRLTMTELQKLATLHFILSNETFDLVYKIAPEILKRLSKASVTELKEVRGAVRGRVNWQRTYTYRYAHGGDPTIFLCTQRSSIFDLPENRVLLFMLKKILKVAQSLSRLDFDAAKFDSDNIRTHKWIDKVEAIGYQTVKLLRNPFIRNIDEIYELSDKQIEHTERARLSWYKDLAIVAKVYLSSVNEPIAFLNRSLANKVLEPLNKDTLYEIAVLFKIINLAKEEGWQEVKLSLLGGGRRIVSQLKKGNKTLKVYFQGLPSEFSEVSKYGNLMSSAGLSDRLRRPDIVLEFIEANKKKYCIVEVKRSANRQYLVDGAYKLFGYLKDYEEVNGVSELQGVLVGWSNIKEQNYLSDDDIYITSWPYLSKTITVLLS